MRTLKEIDDWIDRETRNRTKKLVDGAPGEFFSEDEIFMMQRNARSTEKITEMYAILKVFEEYLTFGSLDGKMERQPLRKKLKEMLDAL